MSEDVQLVKDHPLDLELGSLRQAAAHFQEEAHRSNVQLQRLSLQHKDVTQRWQSLERERTALLDEVDVLRSTAPSLSGSQRDALQVQELTLSLRRLSDKLDLADEELLRRDEEIVAAQAERQTLKSLELATYDQLALLQTKLEKKTKEMRELSGKLRTEEQQRKMSDLALEEYADLVRTLEGRDKAGERVGRASVDGLQNARIGLDKLLKDSNADSEKLHAEVAQLHEAIERLQLQLDSERKAAAETKRSLAEARLALQKLKRDDKAAAKMVSRYMKFSQASTDILHDTISGLKSRQEAIVSSYEARLEQTRDSAASEKRHHEQLQRAFEDVTEDISRESYGRRREIALRLAVLAREEMLFERWRRWLLRAKESQSDSDMPSRIVESIFAQAGEILAELDRSVKTVNGECDSSSARVIAAEATVQEAVRELQRETDLRLYYQRQLHLDRVARLASSTISKALDSKLRLAELSAASMARQREKEATASAMINSEGDPVAEGVAAHSCPLSAASSPQIASVVVEDASPIAGPRVTGDEFSAHTKGYAHTAPTPPTEYVAEEDEVKAGSIQAMRQYPYQSMDPEPMPPGLSSESTGVLDQMTEVVEMADSPEFPDSTDHVERIDDDGLVMSQEDRLKLSGLDTDVAVPLLLVNADADLDRCEDPSGPYKNLLQRLSSMHDRYAPLQKDFRDCCISLQQMKAAPPEPSRLPKDSVSVIIERLNDHCEDARVELEIRVADEERIAKGYETLLMVPGALLDELGEKDVLAMVEAFIDGSDLTVTKARDSLRHKLEDLQHDIAVVKQAMADTSPLVVPHEALPTAEEKPKQTGWSAWTGSILAPSRSASPAPSFGAVMTSPRLRHASSSSSLRHEAASASPIASLGLRIPMPDGPRRNESSHQGTPMFMQRGAPRPRVSSNVLGLGFKGGLMQGSRVPKNFSPNSPPLASTAPMPLESDDDVE